MSIFYKYMLVAVLFLNLISTEANCQPEKPLLMLETGMHNARCNSGSTDIHGRYLLSCSNDKTARLWEASTGKLLNILRTPIGEADEGKLYACALDPEAKIAAVAGYTGMWEKNDNCIYILNPFTGQMINKICNLPQVTNRLEFSKDGKWLAAGLAEGGVRVYNAETWQVAATLREYTDHVYGLSFDKLGNLATVCFDGYLRLYRAPDFSLVTQTNMLSGNKPFSVAFNAAGNLMAVGYNDNTAVDVVNTSNLQIAYKPDVSDIPFNNNEDVSCVSFSDDGTTLYGGGVFTKVGFRGRKYAVRKWANAGKGDYQDIPLLEDAVLGIKHLPGGKMVLFGAYPDIAVVDPSGTALWYHAADNINFAANDPADFMLSNDEETISFRSLSGRQLFFKIGSRSINEDNSFYYPPLMETGRVKLTSWRNTVAPAINGAKLDFLAANETCRSACINSEGTKIAWGGDYNLYLTDNMGKLKWQTSLPEVAFAVNIAGQGKVITVALGDGTIRWYSIVTGKELLALYVGTDRRRWVLFTPKGYYDASPGAEDLLGWHVNNGPDKSPVFFPASRFKQMYRPDIIDAITEYWSEDEAIGKANSNNGRTVQTITSEKLPPTIRIINPVSGTSFSGDMVSISYTVEAPENAPASNIDVRVNSRPVAIQRGMKILEKKTNTIEVNIPKENCTVSLFAENANGVSPEAKLDLKFDSLGQVVNKDQKKPRLFILAIGVSDYNNRDIRLNYAATDARAFIDFFADQKGSMYEDVVPKLLLDKEATRDDMEAALDWIKKQTTKKDVAMIFFAGHGINNNSGVFYMGGVAADLNNLQKTCLNFSVLTQTVAAIQGKVVVFIDACHSGNVTGGRAFFGDIGNVASDLGNSRNGAVVFTSSMSRQSSLESPDWKHGAFTLALLEGLKGAGASIIEKTKINIKSLDAFISVRVQQLTNGKQQPTTVYPPDTPDFTIAVPN